MLKTLLISAAKGAKKLCLMQNSNNDLFNTCGWVNSPLNQVVILVNPLPVAFEVDLRGWGGATGQGDGLVLHDVLVLGLNQEVR